MAFPAIASLLLAFCNIFFLPFLPSLHPTGPASGIIMSECNYDKFSTKPLSGMGAWLG